MRLIAFLVQEEQSVKLVEAPTVHHVHPDIHLHCQDFQNVMFVSRVIFLMKQKIMNVLVVNLEHFLMNLRLKAVSSALRVTPPHQMPHNALSVFLEHSTKTMGHLNVKIVQQDLYLIMIIQDALHVSQEHLAICKDHYVYLVNQELIHNRKVLGTNLSV